MLKRLRDWHARLKAWLVDRIDLVLENLALRHQLMVYERARRLRGSDRLGWCLLWGANIPSASRGHHSTLCVPGRCFGASCFGHSAVLVCHSPLSQIWME
jgi:hypothetical protein